MFKTILILLALILVSMCKTPAFNTSSYDRPYLLAGHGGGVTGREKGTCINDEGRVYDFEGLAEWQFSYKKKLSADQYKQLESNFKVLKLQEVELKQPGNIYKFIEWSDGKQKKRLTWNESIDQNAKAANLFYEIFKSMTSN